MPEDGQCAGRRQSGSDTDGGVQRTGDHHRDVDPGGDVEHRPRTAQRSHLQHSDVGGPGAHHGQRVGRLADALVGGHRNVGQPAHLGEFPDGPTRLLQVLQFTVRGERGCSRHSLLHGPPSVGVDPHRRDQRPHGPHPGHIVVQALPGLGDLDLRRHRTRKPGQHLGHLIGSDCRHGGVHRDPLPQWRWRCAVCGFDTRCKPLRGLRHVVLQEGAELPPSRRAIDQRDLADRDATEAHPHRQCDDMQPVKQIVEIREHQIARSRFSQYGFRRSRLSSLPVGLRGSSSMMSMLRGIL